MINNKYTITGCGIAGIATFKCAKKYLEPNNLFEMLNALRHRGPDGHGAWSNEFVQLGHTRLSIVDLSNKGSQPMIRDNLVITYNGEIYNFQDIRSQLQKLGINFISETDTEIIIRAYQIWGTDCIKKFDGMFAFCIYDISNNTMFFARDHIGIKPLYYYIDNTFIIFSSEVKSLLKSNQISRQINKDLLYKQVLFSSNLQCNLEQTLIKNICSLLPGHYMIVNLNDGSRNIKKYWDLPIQETRLTNTNSELSTHLKYLMEKSVQNRLIGDVEISSLLSGGLGECAL